MSWCLVASQACRTGFSTASCSICTLWIVRLRRSCSASAGTRPGTPFDGFVLLVTETEQRNLRFSTELHATVGDSAGPLEWCVVEPMRTWRATLAPNPIGLEFDVTWYAWCQAQFADRSVGFLLVETRVHDRLLLEGAVMHESGEVDPIVDVRHELRFSPALDLDGGRLNVTTRSGASYPVDVDASARGGYMAGAGYGGGHGGGWAGTMSSTTGIRWTALSRRAPSTRPSPTASPRSAGAAHPDAASSSSRSPAAPPTPTSQA